MTRLLMISMSLLLVAVPVSAASAAQGAESEKCVEVAPVYVLGKQVTPGQKRCIPWF
jgi:hypothetical protein